MGEKPLPNADRLKSATDARVIRPNAGKSPNGDRYVYDLTPDAENDGYFIAVNTGYLAMRGTDESSEANALASDEVPGETRIRITNRTATQVLNSNLEY